jgi:hypothetical protein
MGFARFIVQAKQAVRHQTVANQLVDSLDSSNAILSAATTLLTAILIVVRVLKAARMFGASISTNDDGPFKMNKGKTNTQRRSSGGRSWRNKAAEIVVESAAIYVVVGIAYAILAATDSPQGFEGFVIVEMFFTWATVS